MQLSLVQWLKNPVDSALSVQSQVLSFLSNYSRVIRSDISSSVPTDLMEPKFYLHLELSTEIGAANDSFPSCALLEGRTNATACPSCQVSSIVDTNATFACWDLSLLCGSSPSPATASLTRLNRHLQSSSSETITSSVFGALLGTFESTLSTRISFTAESMKPVVVVVCSLLGIILLGSLWLLRWDRLDHDEFVLIIPISV